MNIADYLLIIFFIIFFVLILILIIGGITLYFFDKRQNASPVLRNYPLLGRMRYFLEQIGPELRQYWFDSDREARPFSRADYQHVVKSAKYKEDIIGFGSTKDYEKPGYYIKKKCTIRFKFYMNVQKI